MHIAEGALSGTRNGLVVLGIGWVGTLVGTRLGLRSIDETRLPRVALLAAAFFVVSLVPLPIGPTSVHLVLTGLMGLLLKWAAFPGLLVALLLQATIFGVGGLTTLGINTLVMAAPAVIAGSLSGPLITNCATPRKTAWIAFFCGLCAVILGALFNALAISAAAHSFKWIARVSLISHAVTAPLEGIITAIAVGFLRKVYPELFMQPPTLEHQG